MKKTTWAVLALILLSACQARKKKTARQDITQATPVMCAPKAVDALADTDQPAPVFSGLGDYDFPITTRSEEARKFFLQGFKLANSFNHAEAARSFIYATKLDPECAMCHWGLAYVLGPNYNVGMDPSTVELANESVEQALRYIYDTTPREQALIRAIARRYPPEPVEDRSEYDIAYIEAMRQAYRQFPKNDHIAAMLAEAIMDAHPWDLWSFDGDPRPWTPEILEILEGIIGRNPKHIAAIHLYIHATEASQTPELAKAYAARLPELAPGAGHLVHMPSHTYIRTGDYHLGSMVNSAAVEVDSQYVSACHAAGVYPLAYYPHNFHFLSACAAFEGRSKLSIQAARRMVAKLDMDAMRQPGLETIQHYWSIPYYLYVKFGKWDEALAEPRPGEDLIYPRAIWHYARGIAFVAKGQAEEAREELEGLRAAAASPAVQGITIWDINSVSSLLKIAEKVLSAEIANSEGRPETAIQLLTEAVELEDGLNYNEPPDWFFSIRHHLGPILLAQKRYAEAEELYKRDLELFRENGYALKGLYESLMAQGREEEAKAVKKRFDKAWQWADVRLEASKVVS
ncbi:MAG: hypothetical protein KDD06_05120 [Phaeodactylibacter sp.]|nr:hypothetical protein [Phaeodactylibacter sp.]